jgi:dephospho-CoA kinase
MTDAASGIVVVGLVGRIAAGKSTVARALAARGADVVDADALAHEALDEPAVRAAIGRRFGAAVVRDDGRVDRAALAAIVFGADAAAAAALRDLEALVHPRVRARIEAALARFPGAPRRDDGGRRVVVLDVPLLMQSGWDELCERLLLVACDEEVRRRRLADRGWTADHRDRRDAAWARAYRPPPPRKTAIVDASGDVAYIQAQIDRWWRALD